MAVSEDDKKPVRMGLVFMSPVHMAFYIFLVVLGVVGNATLMTVIGKSIRMDRGGGRNSDIIIVNMALSNLLVSLMRNLLLILSDFGLQVCQGLRWQISRLQTKAVCALLFFFYRCTPPKSGASSSWVSGCGYGRSTCGQHSFLVPFTSRC